MKDKFGIFFGFVCYKIILTDLLNYFYKGHLESLRFKIYLWFVGWAGHYAYHPMHE
ncbi:hypothetical protein [uncultured Mediterranean phage uvMED]|nr:hypothetical protein [uncultured Mediterranean phage uvMED]